MKDSVIGMAHAAVYSDELHEEPDVSPTAKSTDASKLSLPIGWVAGIVVFFVGFAGQQAYSLSSMRSDVRDILTRMEYEAKLNDRDSKLLDQRFAALDAQISAAGLRNANMVLSQELAKQKGK